MQEIMVIPSFSVKPLETTDAIYGKVNRRIEHLSKLKTNTSNYESEGIVVSAYTIYSTI